MRLKLVLILVMVVGFSGFGYASSVGVVPSSINFGEVDQGETVEVDIFLRSTNVDQNYTVEPEASKARSSILFDEGYSLRNEVSEQDFSDWISYETSEVNPDTLEDRSEVPMSNPPRVDGRFTLVMEVPNDAEPGVRRGRLRVNPDISPAESGGAGASMLGETQMSFSFSVAGDVERDIVAEDVRGFRMEEDEASVEVLLNNRGSVTTSTQGFEVDVMDQHGSSMATLSASGTSLEPGESSWVGATWREDDEIREGTYQVDGEVDYFTGQAFASGSFSLPEIEQIEVVPDDSPQAEEEDDPSDIPVWLIAMVLVLLGVLMWSFDIEPFWILSIVGFLAVSAFILFTSVSNYLLLVLIMMVAIFLYAVM